MVRVRQVRFDPSTLVGRATRTIRGGQANSLPIQPSLRPSCIILSERSEGVCSVGGGWKEKHVPILLLAGGVEHVEQGDLVIDRGLFSVRILDRRVVLVYEVRLDELDGWMGGMGVRKSGREEMGWGKDGLRADLPTPLRKRCEIQGEGQRDRDRIKKRG